MFNQHSEIIVLKDAKWLERQTVAGQAVSESLKYFAKEVTSGVKNISLKDIEQSSLKILKEYNCTPTFLNYKGFPGAVCTSVNENLVHGVPTDYVLQDGDVVTLDLGATFEGAIADAAFTVIHGTPKDPRHVQMLKLCQDSLMAGVDAFKVDSTIGAIGFAIYRKAREQGFGIVTNYGGHGISYNNPHSAPFVANKGQVNEGPRIQKWMSIAIEPMLIMGGSAKTKVLKDKWTVAGSDIGCHFEHSVTTDDEGVVHIITGHDMDVLDYVGTK